MIDLIPAIFDSSRFAPPTPSPGESSKLQIRRNPTIRVRQAVRDNNVPLLARLQHKTDLRNVDRNRLTSLSWAAIEGNLEVFEWLLLDYGHDDQELSRDIDNNTLLHLLASIPSPPSSSPHTHLHHTSPHFPPKSSSKPLTTQITTALRMTQLYYTLFPFLLDWSNQGGKTALHLAAQSGNTAFINLLCDFGAELDLTDLQGNTPLHYASAWGHLDTIKVLLERGCQVSARNYEGFSASDFAFSNGVLSGLQHLAREIFEERRTRRKVDNLGNGSGFSSRQSSNTSIPQIGGANGGEMSRMRSESVSTSMSYGSAGGSGSAVSSNPAQTSATSQSTGAASRGRPSPIFVPPRPNPPLTSVSVPNSRRPSQSQSQITQHRPQSQSPPPPPQIVRPSAPHRETSIPGPGAGTNEAMGRYNMPSTGIETSVGPPVLAPPLPNLGLGAMMGSVGMRRVNSAQTEHSAASETGAYKGPRGPMI